MTARTTWKRLATIFAAGLNDTICTEHVELRDDCPYCRDTAALLLYEAKSSGQSGCSWQDVVTELAGRFQHFEECTAHARKDIVAEPRPFCDDEARWQRYVDFCGRQGVRPVRRDVMLDGAVAVSIYDVRRNPVVGNPQVGPPGNS